MALFRSPSYRNKIGNIVERTFDKNRRDSCQPIFKKQKKGFGYILVYNRTDTPSDKQVLSDIFGSCRR